MGGNEDMRAIGGCKSDVHGLGGWTGAIKKVGGIRSNSEGWEKKGVGNVNEHLGVSVGGRI